MRSCTDGLVPVYSSGTNDTDRGFLLFHHPRLYAAGVGTQEPVGFLMNIKSVLHIPRRMVFRKIEGGKIMPVVFDLRALCHGKAQPSENMNDPVTHQGDRVVGAQGKRIAR